MEDRDLAKVNGVGRAVLGAAFVVAPGLGRVWLGSDASQSTTKAVARALGVRDLALGTGLVMALQNDEPARNWVTSAAVADAVDTAATLIAWPDLPRAGRLLVLGMAVGSAVQMGLLSRRVA